MISPKLYLNTNNYTLFKKIAISSSLIQMDHSDQQQDETDDNYDARKYQVSFMAKS